MAAPEDISNNPEDGASWHRLDISATTIVHLSPAIGLFTVRDEGSEAHSLHANKISV